MLSPERQSLLLEILEQEGKLVVNALASRLSTSKETIRRDLKELEANGLLKRTHGGAIPVDQKRSEGYELPVMARSVYNPEEKQQICIAAAGLLEDGDTIFLDNSSTTMYLLKYIPKDIKITVLTNSIQIMLEAGKLDNDNITVISFGGMFNVKNYSLVGMLSKSFAQNFYPDKAFMSCRGVDEQKGMTEGGFQEIEIKRDMLTRAKQVILLLDHTKFGLVGPFYLGALDEVDCVITDSKADRQQLKMFEDRKIRVIYA